MPLVITLRSGDSFTIGTDICVTIIKKNSKEQRLIINAPLDKKIKRVHKEKENGRIPSSEIGVPKE